MQDDGLLRRGAERRRLIRIVYQDDRVLAFHHAKPAYAGSHIVVIPKRHVPSLLSPEASEELPALLRVIREVEGTR